MPFGGVGGISPPPQVSPELEGWYAQISAEIKKSFEQGLTTAAPIPDLFLESGAVIDWGAGNVTLTHSAGNLTVAGASLVNVNGTIRATGGSLQAYGASSFIFIQDTNVTNEQWRLQNSGGNLNIQVRTDGDAALRVPVVLDAGNGDMTLLGNLTIGTIGNTIRRNVDTSLLTISGGTSEVVGANMILFGSTHGSRAGDIVFRRNATEQMDYDFSADLWTISGNLTVTGPVTFNNTLVVGNTTTITAAIPRLRFEETDASADNGNWDIIINAELLQFRVYNDADSAGVAWLSVNRTGNTIDDVNLLGTAATVAGTLTITGTATASGGITIAGSPVSAGVGDIRFATNTLILQGGTSGFQVHNAAGSANNISMTDAGNLTLLGNLTVNGTLAATLSTASQPNITGIGTLATGTVPAARISGGSFQTGDFAVTGDLTVSSQIGVGAVMAGADLVLRVSGVIAIAETTTPGTGDTGFAKIYSKTDNLLYFMDGAGTERTITLDP